MSGLISLLFSNPIVFAIVAFILIAALTFHEFAHAWVADRLGDPTPRMQGRVTLNPAAHLDPVGTALLFLAGFGWGRPVEFDPYNLRNPVRDTAIIAAAGPASNLLLALVLSIVLPLLGNVLPPDFGFVVGFILQLSIAYNVMLAVFNLVPIHPLDGSKILSALLPNSSAIEYEQFMHRYGFILLIALVFPWSGQSALSALINPPIDLLSGLFAQLATFISAIS